VEGKGPHSVKVTNKVKFINSCANLVDRTEQNHPKEFIFNQTAWQSLHAPAKLSVGTRYPQFAPVINDASHQFSGGDFGAVYFCTQAGTSIPCWFCEATSVTVIRLQSGEAAV